MALNIRKLLSVDPEGGEEQKSEETEIQDKVELAAVRAGKGYLNRISKGSVAKYVDRRWRALEDVGRKIQTELKVNHRRFHGDTFAQIDPKDPNKVHVPYGTSRRRPPTINKIRRTVHRYTAQTTADEPIMEGVPVDSRDESRDAAEAATEALRGEWSRLSLQRRLQKTVQLASIFRSAFWLVNWDRSSGGRVPAQKFIKNEDTGRQELHFVDSSGNKVDSADDAAKIWEGNVDVEIMTPFNVRWTGGDYAHESDEVMVAKVVSLGQLYEMDGALKKVKLEKLLGDVPGDAEKWLNDIRGAGGIKSKRSDDLDEEALSVTGEHLMEADNRLDEPVLLIHYYRPVSREYPSGFEAVVAGEHTVRRGGLRYGRIPIVHFKCLEDPTDPLGVSVVDLLRDPQELLDFVNTQILRFLQSMKSRWFVPQLSGVSKRDLMNPHNSVIPFNPQAGAPTRENPNDLPQALPQVLERFEEQFDDESGIHDTMKGKHVPGVSSGRHAEALRSGDETILGLTRSQIQEALEAASEVMLAMVKKEWKRERKVSFFQGREYVEEAFNRKDFGDTSKVRLKKGTLLMLTPAQKLETLFGYVEMGALTVDELRRLAPLSDTAGISVTEDPHYQKARREGHRFLKGPDEDLTDAREAFEKEVEVLQGQLEDVATAAALGAAEDQAGEQDVTLAQARIQDSLARAQQEWAAEIGKHLPQIEQWEALSPAVGQAHVTEHLRVLASTKVERMPSWWVDPFKQHTIQHIQSIQQLAAQQAQAQQGGGQQQ